MINDDAVVWKSQTCVNKNRKFKFVMLKQIRQKIFSSNEEIPLASDLQTILRLIPDAFWEFYNTTDSAKVPEINTLKNSSNDSNHILNIEKLATVISNNENRLKEYFLKDEN